MVNYCRKEWLVKFMTGLWNEDSVWWDPRTWFNTTTTETKEEKIDIAGVSYRETLTTVDSQ